MNKVLSLTLVFIALLGFAVACADDDDSSNNPPGDTTDGDVDSDSDSDTDAVLAMGCEASERVGGFMVMLAEDYTGVTGAVMNGVNPSGVSKVRATSGSCTLLGPPDLFCDPPCIALGETCGPDGTCIEAPSKQDAGTVNITGMVTAVSLEAKAITSEYSAIINDPFPGFTPGANLTLEATGGDIAAFTLDGIGPAPVVTASDTVTVQRDAPAELTWQAEDIPGTQMHILLDVNVHGARTGWIECDAEDTGSFDIPADLVTQLIDLGLSGFPKVELSRRSVDKTDIDAGCVEFVVYAPKTLSVEIPGFTSCNSDDDCEDGQYCNEERVCQ